MSIADDDRLTDNIANLVSLGWTLDQIIEVATRMREDEQHERIYQYDRRKIQPIDSYI